MQEVRKPGWLHTRSSPPPVLGVNLLISGTMKLDVLRPKERWTHERAEERQKMARQQIEAVVVEEDQPQVGEGHHRQQQQQGRVQEQKERPQLEEQRPSPVTPSEQQKVVDRAAECENRNPLLKQDGQAQVKEPLDDLKEGTGGTANQPQAQERSQTAALPAGWGMRQQPSGRQHCINLHTRECFAASRYLVPNKMACHKAKESRPPLRAPIKASPRFILVASHREAKQKRRAQIYAVNKLLRQRRQRRCAGAV